MPIVSLLSCLPRLGAALLLAALTIEVAPSAAQAVPANNATAGPRTGMIIGQVVDARGTPVPEAIVRTSLPRNVDGTTSSQPRVMADGEGRFFFTDLAAGQYYIQASKEGYAGGTYGMRTVSSDSQRLPLAEG